MSWWTVAALQQVAQLVDHHVFQAVRRIKRQPHVDADTPCRRLATAPAARHVAIRELARLHAHDGLPRGHERGHTCAYRFAPCSDFFGSRLGRTRHGCLRGLRHARCDPRALRPDESLDFGIRNPRRCRHVDVRSVARDPQVYVFHALADDMRLDSVYDRDFARGRRSGDAGTCPFVETFAISHAFSLFERLFFTFGHFTRAHGPRLVGIRHNATIRRRARSRRRRFGKARTRQRSPWRFLCCALLRP